MKTTKLLIWFFTFASISTAPLPAAAPPDLSRLVFIGDSLLAGFRNSSLRSDWQASGIAAVIARQAGVPLPQPLIAPPGMPSPLEQVDPANPLAIVRGTGVSTGRVDLIAQPFNLAVPGHTVGDALHKRPDLPVDSLTDLILGLPGLSAGQVKSQVEWAETLKPTTIIAWIGNNDVLNAVLKGDLAAMTGEAKFTNDFSALLDRLAATGARLYVANLPDVDSIPFVVPISALAHLLGVPLPAMQAALGVAPGDFLTLDRVPDAVAILQRKKSGPLSDPEVLDAEEVSGIRAATVKYNAFIAAQCAEKGAQLVDMNAFLKQLLAQGASAGNARLSAQFLGGIFSLDGIHPTVEGAAVSANEFIRALNRAGANVPPVVWLATRREGENLVASWPAEATQYVLQTSSQISGPWESGQFSATVESGQHVVRVPRNADARFFRLMQAPPTALSSNVHP